MIWRSNGSDFDAPGGKSTIQKEVATDWPPVIQKHLNRFPVGDPAEYYKTFLENAAPGARGEYAARVLTGQETHNQERQTDQQVPPPVAKKGSSGFLVGDFER
jgi:hypothetical protein